mgnify:CR=1 FL=1
MQRFYGLDEMSSSKSFLNLGHHVLSPLFSLSNKTTSLLGPLCDS